MPSTVPQKDPAHRVDILPSTSVVKIQHKDIVLAESKDALFLFETRCRPRYYFPPSAVNWEALKESKTTSFCVYKGQASYWSVKNGDDVFEDLVWSYKEPTSQSEAIAGYLCFYNEKVDVWVDGIKEEEAL